MNSCSQECSHSTISICPSHQEVVTKDVHLDKAYRLCHKLQQSLEKEKHLNALLEEENQFLKRERTSWVKLQENSKSLEAKLLMAEKNYKDLKAKHEADVQQYQNMILTLEDKCDNSYSNNMILDKLENRISQLELTRSLTTKHNELKTNKPKTPSKRVCSKKASKCKRIKKRRMSTDIYCTENNSTFMNKFELI